MAEECSPGWVQKALAIAFCVGLLVLLFWGGARYDEWWHHAATSGQRSLALLVGFGLLLVAGIVFPAFGRILLLLLARYALMGLLLLPFLVPVIAWGLLSPYLGLSPAADAWCAIAVCILTLLLIGYTFLLLPCKARGRREGSLVGFLRRVERKAPPPWERLRRRGGDGADDAAGPGAPG